MERARNQAVAVALSLPVAAGMVAWGHAHSGRAADPVDSLPATVMFLCTQGDEAVVFADHVDDPQRGVKDRAEMWGWRDRHLSSECGRVRPDAETE